MKKTVIVILCAAVSGIGSAQTAEELDGILGSREITYAQAARFVLASADASLGGGDAFQAARNEGWLPRRAEADRPIRLGELSLLIMKSFGLRGGILYTLFPGPRYANRELIYLGLLRGRTDPGGSVDGGSFLQILGRTLTFTGDDAALAEEAARRRLLEDLAESQREGTRKAQGISSGTEDLREYEGTFELE
ncbi:MAG: hypothetical protein LBK77_01635 [Spirochaetaceae bacterium]|jgi:hypothetical protein|nr:hypothetical protein [Spirochaetaceae bacterium]